MRRKRTPDRKKTGKTSGRTRKVRSRTMRRLRKLILAGAASGAAIHAGCTYVKSDPGPSPLRCHENMGWYDYENSCVFSASASWDFDWPTDRWLVDLSIRISNSGGDPLIFTGNPQVTDATMVDFTQEPLKVTFLCDPTDDATEVHVTIPLGCDGHTDLLAFTMDVSGTRGEGLQVPIDGPFDCWR